MVLKKPTSPTSSPVKITVSSGGKGGRSMGLTSPVPRHSLSNNPNSPLPRANRNSPSGGGRFSSMSKDETITEEINSKFLSYTVHIPPTPDRQPISEPSIQNPKPDRSFISGTIFTGGFNSMTRGHVIGCSTENPEKNPKLGLICGMKGCDEKLTQNKCECRFKLCKDCYLDCVKTSGGHRPGCKDAYRNTNDESTDDDDDEERFEEEDQAWE